MGKGLVDSATQMEAPDDRRIYGVAIAQVISNGDKTGQGRVKVRFTWLPGFEPWARVAAQMAGSNSGSFFMPQEKEEVLIAFNHGDIRDPYIVGCIWNGKDQPPKKAANDPVNQRIIRTPKGLQVEFDDQKQSITISNAKDKRIVIGSDSIEISLDKDGNTKITLNNNGDITLKAASSIKLDAPSITISASQKLELSGSPATVNGGTHLTLDAAKIDIG